LAIDPVPFGCSSLRYIYTIIVSVILIVMNITDLPKHHAVLITHSNRESVGNTLFSELQKLSPVHRFFNQTVLDIEAARNLITWVNTPYNEEKIALISFHTIGLEAQNALLKVLEEPRVGVRFILLTSNTSSLIDTLLSRVHIVQSEEHSETPGHSETFLSTSPSLRMKLPYITDILSRVDEEDRKDRESVRAFILSLISTLRANSIESKYIIETTEIASYAADPSASGKALLEYLALLLPQTKP
jgi:hypothetical protein